MTDKIPPKPRRVVTRPHAPGSEATGGRAQLARNLPSAMVVPPVVAVLDDIASLVKTSVDQMRTKVTVEGETLGRSEADALLKMAQTLASVQASKKQAKQDGDEELGALSEEELQLRMVEAIDLANPAIRERLMSALEARVALPSGEKEDEDE